MTIFIATSAGFVTITVGVAGCVRWIFKRGQISGKEQAVLEADRLAQVKAQAEWQDKVRALEAQVAQIQAELDLIRPQKP
jgi:hypothetical protein